MNTKWHIIIICHIWHDHHRTPREREVAYACQQQKLLLALWIDNDDDVGPYNNQPLPITINNTANDTKQPTKMWKKRPLNICQIEREMDGYKKRKTEKPWVSECDREGEQLCTYSERERI